MSRETGTSSPITLLIVDDHPVVRDGLRGMFASAPGFAVLGEAASGEEAVERAAALDPDVILMDLRMPSGGGVAAIAHLTRTGARARILVLTTYDTDTDTIPAIEAGATGYLLKDAPRDELFTAVRAAAEGRTVLSPAVASRLVSAVRTFYIAGLASGSVQHARRLGAWYTVTATLGVVVVMLAEVLAHG